MQSGWLEQFYRRASAPKTDPEAAAPEAPGEVSRRAFLQSGLATGVSAGMAAGGMLAQAQVAQAQAAGDTPIGPKWWPSRWGPQDESGGSNWITPAKVLETAKLIKTGKIYDIADIAADPHYAARGMIDEHRLDDGKSLKLPGIVPKMSGTPAETKWLGPALGEHTEEVLGTLGYTPEEMRSLRDQGVI